MLELIVLGQIPGTNFQITYWQTMAIMLCLATVVHLQREIKARRMLVLQLASAKQLRKFIRHLQA